MANPVNDVCRETSLIVDLGVLAQLLSFYIRSINITVSRDLDKKLSGYEVARGTGKISTLLLVARHPGICPSAIANVIMRDRSAMSRLVTQMANQGLVHRKISTDDSRAQALYLTPYGEKLAAKVTRLVTEQEADFFQSVSAFEKDFIIKVLKKVLNETDPFNGRKYVLD